MSNYYTILGVSEKATDEEIKQAYRMLAKRYHPDLHPGDAEAAKRFALVNEANEAIGDPVKRKAYDEKRAAEQRLAAARAAAASAAATRSAGGNPNPMAGMSQGARTAYASSAAGAAAVINDAYRKGYNEGMAAASAQRNTTAETWKRSAESWQKEAENRRRDVETLRRELDAMRRKCEEQEAETDRVTELLRKQIAKTRDARLDGEVESAAAADLRETLEGKIRELENAIRDGERKIEVEREARRFSDADKVRLSRELSHLRAENAELKEKLSAWEEYGASEEEDETLQAIADEWQLKVKDSKKQYKDTYYGTLGVTFWATREEIETAYFATLKKLKGKADEEQRRKIADEAFGTLHDPQARASYNISLGVTDGQISDLRREEEEYKRTQERIEEKFEAETAAAHIAELTQRANEGDGEAALELGVLYLTGETIQKDDTQAAHWFSLGADVGNADALYNLGLCYLNGEGVEADASRGVELINQALVKGSKLAESFIKDANK